MTFLLYAATVLALLWMVRRGVRHVSVGAALILFLLPLLVTGKAVLSGGVFGAVDLTYVTEPLADLRMKLGVPMPHNGVISDVSSQVFPWRKAVQEALQHGEWPLRNPYMLSGDILAAAAQPAAYYPFTLIACLLPAAVSLTFTAAITFFLAGLGAFLLARELELRESVALVAAAGWMYATGIAFFILWTVGGSWGLLPWILLATRRCVREPSIRSAALLCVTLTMLVLAGHPETALHVVAVGCAYGLFELLRKRRDVVRILAHAAGAAVIALLLTLIYILPFIEASHQTMEYDFRVNVFATQPHGDTYLQSAVRVARDLFPVFYGERWRLDVGGLSPATASAGSILLALAIVAVIRVRRADTWFFAGLALFGMIAGSNLKQFCWLMQKLPLFDIALNEYFAFGGAFGVVMLAAIGLDDAMTRRSVVVPVIVTIALIVITAGSILPTRFGWTTGLIPDWGRYRMWGEIGCLALAALVLVLHLPRRVTVGALLALLLMQRWCEVGDVYSVLPASVAYPPIPLFAPMKNVREPFRFAGFFQTLTPNMAAYYELEDVRGYEAMTFERYFETYRLWAVPQPVFFNRVDDPNKPFLSFLNVRFMVGYKGWTPPGWRLVSHYGNSELWENPNVIERAFIPRHVSANYSDGDALNEMADAKDFRERAWIKITDLTPQEFANGRGTLSVRRDGYDYDITADMESNGWVVLSETGWKGWRIYVDGQRENWYFANEAFIGLWVPRGRHHVRVVYLPSSFVTGRAISLGTLAAILAALIASAIHRRRRQKV